VKRLSSLVVIASLLFCTAGCGDLLLRGAVDTRSSISGTVLSVQLASAFNSTGQIVQITTVTFIQANNSFVLNFCNDQTSSFPLNQTVKVNFNPGEPCETMIAVVFIG
jgi:hypothetical protein